MLHVTVLGYIYYIDHVLMSWKLTGHLLSVCSLRNKKVIRESFCRYTQYSNNDPSHKQYIECSMIRDSNSSLH